MFKKLVGVFDRARGAPAPYGNALLRDGLQGLSKLDAALRERALAYVCTGAPESVLAELQRFDGGAGILLGRPGKLGTCLLAGALSDDEFDAAKASLSARSVFYQQLEATPPLELLLRLGKLFEAADQGKSLDRRCNAAPDYLLYLVNDALSTSFDGVRPDPRADQRPHWDVVLVDNLLTCAGLPRALALQIVFERDGAEPHHPDPSLERLLAPGSLAGYMLANGDCVESLPAILSAGARLLLADAIGGVAALASRFAALLVRLAVDNNKTVRDAAARHLESIPAPRRLDLLAQTLTEGDGAERVLAAHLLGRTLGPDSIARLDAALAQEASRPVRQAIEGALLRLRAASEAGATEMPPAPTLQPPRDDELGEEALRVVAGNRLELLERHRQAAAAEREQDPLGTHSGRRRERHYQQYLALTDARLATAVLALNQHADPARRDDADIALINETLAFDGRLVSLPGFGLTQLLRWIHRLPQSKGNFWYDPRFQMWLARQDRASIDLRLLEDALEQLGDDEDAVAASCLRPSRSAWPSPLEALPPECVWPYFSAHPALIDEGLGLGAGQRGGGEGFDVDRTLAVLATFPALPARWLPRLMELALGEGRAHRAAARKVLSGVPDIGRRVLASLGSSHQETRGAAARWLGEINYRQAVPELYQALDKETRETVQAALLTALEYLGQDIGPLLAPPALLAGARKGLKARLPGAMAWFPLDDLPSCSWRDGMPVETEIIRWWVVLACKLKEPAGNALLARYLTLLDADSRHALGTMVLRQFIAHDTRAGAKGEYLGSAIGEKGLLGLMHGAPAGEIVAQVQAYLQQHYGRRAQVEALLEAAAGSSDQGVIHFMLGLSLRCRTAYIAQKARALVEQIAQRNGWSDEQLADRTVSHARLDDGGQMEVRIDERVFYMRVGANLKPVLLDHEQRPIKALPAPAAHDAAVLKAARHQFSVCSKEIKKVVAAQSARLHVAMCAGRQWQVDEWREYLQRHPVVGQLVQGLLWMALSGDGRCLHLLRPGRDGRLLGADDEPIVLAKTSLLQLARRDLLTSKQAREWKAHFKAHAQPALFRQMLRARASAQLTSR
ncbi:DUF4132 domain-containing protein [Massilia glaciei]|uniref:DUF4132 domain-containing protein n=1 Tax=Massilia glaciei TaxID=1524097 RepID=A0A2U2HEI2_9BURK|nr:DUF4132 domain-containing protein [Massilia glaciei]PWF42045.1 DUF4132 domain-containing protein [Massilia glaciei]